MFVVSHFHFDDESIKRYKRSSGNFDDEGYLVEIKSKIRKVFNDGGHKLKNLEVFFLDSGYKEDSKVESKILD